MTRPNASAATSIISMHPKHLNVSNHHQNGCSNSSAYIWDFDNDQKYVSNDFCYHLTLLLVFLRRLRVEESRSRLISSPTLCMMSSMPTQLWDKRIGMSRMDYYNHRFVCGYVAYFLRVNPSSFRNIQAYKCVFMGNGFWSPSERKKKSAVGKINGLTQVTPATIAYAVAQVCFTLHSRSCQWLKKMF